ncbi:MAG: hypothetical protein K0Q93_1126 [Nocardioidaceae bacterium]|jgi:hypothetical protein|nr:hypothetical protein [Nocardioidaceae bacterium]
MSDRSTRAALALTGAAGRVLAGVFFLVGKARRARHKALHPRGRTAPGMLRRHGGSRSGVAWLDGAGTDRVLVRLSRSAGLPHPLPDILGLAVRVPVGDGHGDLLFASTGRGRLSRFLLRPARRHERAAHTTLFPFRTPVGAVLLAAFPAGVGHFALAWSRLTGDWNVIGELSMDSADRSVGESPVSFDPVVNTVPGLDSYGWAEQLRQFSYAAARRSRGRADADADEGLGR